MKEFKRYIHLYFRYISMSIKSRLTYKTDTIIGIFGFIVTNTINFLALYLTISSVNIIDGYTIENLIFLYGLCLIPKGIDHILTDNLWTLSQKMVRLGQLDKYLIKPLNTFFQIIAETFQLEGFGEIILGIIFLSIFAPAQNVIWSFNNILGLIIAELLSCFLFLDLKSITSFTAFWLKKSNHIMNTVYNICDTARYPSILNIKIVKEILLYIIPYSLFLFCPIACLLNPSEKTNLIFGIEMNIFQVNLILLSYIIILSSIAIIEWKIGIKKYESAGS